MNKASPSVSSWPLLLYKGGFDTASPTQPPLYVMLNLFQHLF